MQSRNSLILPFPIPRSNAMHPGQLQDTTKLGLKKKTVLYFSVQLYQLILIYTAALSNSQFTSFNDCDDRNDIVTPKNSQLHRPNAKYKSHIDAICAGISPNHISQANFRYQPKRNPTKSPSTTSSSSCEEQSESQEKPHKALHVSRNTLSAILYTVEALRVPNPFSPDILEETASMSGQIDVLSPFSRQTGDNDIPRSNTTLGPTTSVKGPREVMRERTAREARRKAELEQKEALERMRAIEEAILLEERQLVNERRLASNVSQGYDRDRDENDEAAPRTSSQIPITRIASNPQTEKRDCGENIEGKNFNPQSSRGAKQGQASAVGGNFRGTRSRPRQSDNQSKLKQTDHPTSHNPNQGGRSGVSGTRSTFPHAFERWETLSAHWEGLTSFWIRRLEENGREIERDPLMQQLSRQVTDLSAAGANLFHAVVELQRLRASSERKFQRWFFETRTEQERNQEIQASIERKLQIEVEARVAAVAQAATEERERLNAEKQLAEAKRELQISKEEAKRAWEELGRREKEERARTTSLREGLPTVIGGVEVVPMITGPPNRPGTARRTDYTIERSESSRDGNPPFESNISNPGYPQRPYDVSDSYHDKSDSRRTPIAQNITISNPILNDPSFSEQTDGEKSADNIFQPVTETSNLTERKSPQPSPESLESYSDQEEEEEEYEMDIEEDVADKNPDNPAVYQSEQDYIRGSEHYQSDMERLRQYGRVPDVEFGRGIQVTADYLQNPGSYSVPDIEIGDIADYPDLDQQGYSSGPEWSSVPRHHHPTRLSDVMEEDERSRTSASQISRSRD
ncbi:hypothetical protein EPUL_000053 [Erysiphe pulchra]|uniref:Uncharacterized protein n=1 Tax=Erysiphe pulchra TaxID=225359 RepID=A0A2S4Q2E4_9PEZI|nr:hypothetical protein EPUL_000053 [Erysiphe pulchra]